MLSGLGSYLGTLEFGAYAAIFALLVSLANAVLLVIVLARLPRRYPLPPPPPPPLARAYIHLHRYRDIPLVSRGDQELPP